jgi:murein DD-endopeptidase MepM/ murein hydrolase activator NlpD
VALAACTLPATAIAQEGGGAAAPTGPVVDGGGTSVGGAVRPRTTEKRRTSARKRRPSGPRLDLFELKRKRLFLYGHSARIAFRIRSRRPLALKLCVLRAEDRAVVATIDLGERAPGVVHSLPFRGTEAGTLPQGRYLLRISGRKLRAAPSASRTAELEFFQHRFPLVGDFSFGGEDSRFGAGRKGHIHQGQDMSAAEGTPVVAPRGGVIEAVQYQAGGAGHYVVLDGEGEDRDYVFMHLRTGSIPVEEGQRVRTGQLVGEVGSTGSSSGPHLHFEVWVGGWYAGGEPIDPLPLLRAWDSWS